MTAAERCAIIGLISRLKPEQTLEIGYRFGGCTAYLAEFSGFVTSVDLDEHVRGAGGRWPNVSGVRSDSKAYLRKAIAEGWDYDFIVIDGDHSRAGAKADLVLAMQVGRVIVMHDTMNDECRNGYLDAIEEMRGKVDFEANMDFVLNSGIWGGLGLVLVNR